MGLVEKSFQAKKETPVTEADQQKVDYSLTYAHDDESVELDVIERLKANIHQLDELQQRLRFMNSELESIVGSRKR